MPTIYNGGQSQLEFYAINGNVSVNGGLGRPVLINTTSLFYNASFKNPQITGNANDAYSLGHTNAIHDTQTPLRGKATNDIYDANNSHNGYVERYNFNGGDDFDILGGNAGLQAGTSIAGTSLGRKSTLTLNAGYWGYGPGTIVPGQPGASYLYPNTSANIGQVHI